ncbi:uncharacterized protein [Anomalospiza imberbis]|uniref:uncharacterized protein isoform X3 n=1 Tax=Anomalospiza imberbis TaxID=187417 RepID=UPI00358F31A4
MLCAWLPLVPCFCQSAPMAEEKPKYNCTVSEVTIVNLQPEKNSVLLLAGGKPGSDHRNLGFQPPPPRISEKLCQGEKKLCPEKVKREGVLSPSLHRANELCSTENITLKRPVKLAPLEIPVEVKEAQLQKIMSMQREAQMAAQKLMVINSMHNELHVKRVSDMHGESNSPDSIPDPCQKVSRRRFKLRHTKEQQEDTGKAKPLKAMDPSVGEGTKKTSGQRTQKTLSDASKLIENVSKKQKEQGAKQREMDEASLVRRQSIRRMALGDIIQVDDD